MRLVWVRYRRLLWFFDLWRGVLNFGYFPRGLQIFADLINVVPRFGIRWNSAVLGHGGFTGIVSRNYLHVIVVIKLHQELEILHAAFDVLLRVEGVRDTEPLGRCRDK